MTLFAAATIVNRPLAGAIGRNGPRHRVLGVQNVAGRATGSSLSRFRASPLSCCGASGAGSRLALGGHDAVVTAEGPMAVILIVEDDVFIRELAEMMIQDWGHDTLAAGDVDGALSLLRSSQHIDALFTDIRLRTAVVGGYEIANQAVKLRLNLRVLYTTGNTINDKMKTLFVKGAHFLQKPYTQHQLQNSVEELLAA
jgi:CheY-like chemotaxis protein